MPLENCICYGFSRKLSSFNLIVAKQPAPDLLLSASGYREAKSVRNIEESLGKTETDVDRAG